MSFKRWSVLQGDAAVEAEFTRELGVSPILSRLLYNRGPSTVEQARAFLNPTFEYAHDPCLLPDCEVAVDRIVRALRSGETVFVHGDYDVDGITSCAMWTRMLRRLGAKVHPHVPHRGRDGYGVHRQAVQSAKELGATLLLTCDCGIQGHEMVDFANLLDIDVVITDHHECSETLPNALAVVNPHRKDSVYPYRDLSGAGVSFKVAEAVVRAMGHSVAAFRRAYLDFATLGTVADVMPLTGENRIFVANGLTRLRNTKKVGLTALLQLSGLNHAQRAPLTTRDIGWVLGPRLNAAGRLDDAAVALRLMLTDDIHEAGQLAETLERHNADRRAEQERILAEANATLNRDGIGSKRVLVVAGEGWHSGVVGIVAGRLAEVYCRPTLVVALDSRTGLARGSARSSGRFHLHNALQAHRDLFLSCGGHAMAAGFSFRAEMLKPIDDALNKFAENFVAPEDLIPELIVDMDVPGSEATRELCEDIGMFEPFGFGNEEPLLLSRNMRVESKAVTRNGRHVQLQLRCDGGGLVSAIAFDAVSILSEASIGTPLDVIYTPVLDSHRGVRRLQWRVRDARIAGTGSPIQANLSYNKDEAVRSMRSEDLISETCLPVDGRDDTCEDDLSNSTPS